MGTPVFEDLTIPQGEVRTYRNTGDHGISNALYVGYNPNNINSRFEPSIFNHGEIHLDPNGYTSATLVYFTGQVSWNKGKFENYGLIGAQAPDTFEIKTVFAVGPAPNIYNDGSILAEAKNDA